MKKTTLFAFSVFLLLGLFGCSNENGQASTDNDKANPNTQAQSSNKKDVREVVWGQLSAQQKDNINGTWKDGKISKVTLNKDMMRLVKDKSYEGKEVFLIAFPTEGNSEPNNMIVYADRNTFNYIGNGLVD